jgi:uncharacterized protein (DUF1697 family)
VTTHVVLLRGINVGGHKLVAMADLRNLMAELGLAGVQSLLQSGNLVVGGGSRTGSHMERFLETEVERRLGLQSDFFVRTAAEWREVVAQNPFREEARRDPGHLVVTFLKAVPDAQSVRALQAAVRGPEVIRASGNHLYIVYHDGIGRSRLTNVLIEKKLGTRATARNWNTVVKLAALVNPDT